jgi:hypothetical protein
VITSINCAVLKTRRRHTVIRNYYIEIRTATVSNITYCQLTVTYSFYRTPTLYTLYAQPLYKLSELIETNYTLFNHQIDSNNHRAIS